MPSKPVWGMCFSPTAGKNHIPPLHGDNGDNGVVGDNGVGGDLTFQCIFAYVCTYTADVKVIADQTCFLVRLIGGVEFDRYQICNVNNVDIPAGEMMNERGVRVI